jgi:hypothetical protein
MENSIITRNDYMQDSKNLHIDYFFQFATESTKSILKSRIGIDRIKKSENPHFNDIPLKLWDELPGFVNSNKLKLAGESFTLSTKICIYKSIAHKIRSGEISI